MKPAGSPVQPYSYLSDSEKAAVCDAVAESGNVSEAVRRIFGDDRRASTVHAAARADPLAFGADLERAKERFRNSIRAEIKRRAFGYDKAVTYQGVVTDHVTEYSDALLLACARMNLPEFVDKKSVGDVHVHGAIAVEDAPGVWSISDDEAAALSAEGKRMLAAVLREVIKSRRALQREQGSFAAITDQSNIEDAEYVEVDPFDVRELEGVF
ncbi:MAG: hypothetical protein ACLQJR_09165 [Stellaceae bacterium]